MKFTFSGDRNLNFIESNVRSGRPLVPNFVELQAWFKSIPNVLVVKYIDLNFYPLDVTLQNKLDWTWD